MPSIGHVSRRTGLAVSAIRYYEEIGLVHPDRGYGGQRQFRMSDIRRLSFVMIAQEFGFTLPQIKAELDQLPDGRTPTKADWSAISKRFKSALDERIERLERMRDNLDGCIGCGCLSLESCALYNPRDRAWANGTGPRYLLGDRPEEL